MDTYGSTAAQGEGHPRGDQPAGRAAGSTSADTPLPPAAERTLEAPTDSAPIPDTSAPSSTDRPSATPPRPAPPAAPGQSSGVPAPAGASRSHLFGYLAVYTLLRLALVAVLTAVLTIFMPLIVALLFAIIIQLPLSWLLFAGPRRRVNQAMARSSAQRRAERNRLQAALSGEQPPG